MYELRKGNNLIVCQTGGLSWEMCTLYMGILRIFEELKTPITDLCSFFLEFLSKKTKKLKF
jgi:hypothetical protein